MFTAWGNYFDLSDFPPSPIFHFRAHFSITLTTLLIILFIIFPLNHTLELTLHLESKVIKLKQDALHLMNIALAGTTCSQILTLFKFAFRYPKSKESKERGQQLEELEHHFDTKEESPAEEDTVTKKEDEKDAVAQFAEGEPKAKKHKFGKCHDDLKDLRPINQAMQIIPSITVPLSETGVPKKSYSDRSESEGQSIYRCLLLKPNLNIPCTYYTAQKAAVCMHIP